jgi:hypothetical protein
MTRRSDLELESRIAHVLVVLAWRVFLDTRHLAGRPYLPLLVSLVLRFRDRSVTDPSIMVYIRQDRLPKLKEYKYSGVDHSLLSRYVLKPFYTHVVINCFPMSMA